MEGFFLQILDRRIIDNRMNGTYVFLMPKKDKATKVRDCRPYYPCNKHVQDYCKNTSGKTEAIPS